jgi:hypothetical protein
MLRLKHHQTTHSTRDRVLAARPPVSLPTPRHLVVRSSSSNGGSNGHGAGVDSTAQLSSISQAPNPYNWTFDSTKPAKPDPKVQDIPVAAIRRPLGRTRSNGARVHECVGLAGVGGDCGSCSVAHCDRGEVLDKIQVGLSRARHSCHMQLCFTGCTVAKHTGTDAGPAGAGATGRWRVVTCNPPPFCCLACMHVQFTHMARAQLS